MPKKEDKRPYVPYIGTMDVDVGLEYAEAFAELRYEGELAIAGRNSLADQLNAKIVSDPRLDANQKRGLSQSLSKIRELILRDTVL